MREIIDVIINLLIMFICIIFYNLSYAKLNNIKMSINFKNLLIIFVSTCLIIVNNTFCDVVLKMVINLVIFCTELKIIFKDNLKKVISNYVLIFLLIIFIEILLTNFLLCLNFLINNDSANTYTFLNIILTLLVVIIEYFIFSIRVIRQFCRKMIRVVINNINFYLFYVVFIIMAIFGILNIDTFSNKESIKWIMLLFIIFLTLFILIIYLKIHEETLKISNSKLIDYNDKYGKFLDEYKIYKHNIKHKLSAMKSYGNKKVNALIDDLLEEENDFSIKNNNLYNVPNGIKGIVAEKLYNSSFNVLVNNKIKKDPFKNLSPKAFNSISESLGIALDNAIEASSETKNPVIIMELKENKDNLFIKIGNNFCNSIDMENLGTKYYSTKNRGSGLGLFSIMRNRFVKEKINIINDFYYIELQIKKAR